MLDKLLESFQSILPWDFLGTGATFTKNASLFAFVLRFHYGLVWPKALDIYSKRASHLRQFIRQSLPTVPTITPDSRSATTFNLGGFG